MASIGLLQAPEQLAALDLQLADDLQVLEEHAGIFTVPDDDLLRIGAERLPAGLDRLLDVVDTRGQLFEGRLARAIGGLRDR